jgi:acetyl-CoA carboxylase carboxyl transferase subunit beta
VRPQLQQISQVLCRAEVVNGPISVNPSKAGQADPVTAAAEGAKAAAGKPVDRSKGLWTRCDKCGVILYIKHLKVGGSGRSCGGG